MKYIDYKNMKDFYTIAEVCRLFEMEMIELQRYSEKYKIHPQEDQYGNWGFRKQKSIRQSGDSLYSQSYDHFCRAAGCRQPASCI